VRVELPPDLPLAPIDGLLIEQVLVNLLENAIKYTPAGSAIEIGAEAGEAMIVVDVADRGPGVAPGEETRIFDKLYRSPRDANKGGVGLGLAICQAIIQAHGGRIWAENRAGGGALFRFTLPIVGQPPQLENEESPTS
jgi:two-component system sensor histidine kinase KdpD